MGDTQYDEVTHTSPERRAVHAAATDGTFESCDELSAAIDTDSLSTSTDPITEPGVVKLASPKQEIDMKLYGADSETGSTDGMVDEKAPVEKMEHDDSEQQQTAEIERSAQSDVTAAVAPTSQLVASQPVALNTTTSRWSAAATGKSQSARARINAEQLIEEYAATVGYEQAVGYKLLREIVTLQANRTLVQSLSDASDVCNAAGDFDVIEADIRFPLLNGMMDKFLNQEYASLVAFVTDFRTMVACLERLFGADHLIAKRAVRLGTVFEQKLALLPRDMRTLVQNAAMPRSSEIAELTNKRPQRSTAATGSSSVSQSHATTTANDDAGGDSACKPPPIKFNFEDVDMNVVDEWERRMWTADDMAKMRAMPELAEIAVFLSAARNYLGFAPTVTITIADLERAILVADRSSLLETIMTGLLRHRRDKMDKLAVTNTPCLVQVLTDRYGCTSPFADPDTFVYNYEIWERKLRDQLAAWYKVLAVSCKNDVNEACWRLGIHKSFFERIGFCNPLANTVVTNDEGVAVISAPSTRFHQLPVEHRVLIVAALCNWAYSHVESLKHSMLEQSNPFESREQVLGRDSDGRLYVYISHLREYEFRLFRIPSFDSHAFFGDENEAEQPEQDAVESSNESLVAAEPQPQPRSAKRVANNRSRAKAPVDSSLAVERRSSPRKRLADTAPVNAQQTDATDDDSASQQGSEQESGDGAWTSEAERNKPRSAAKKRRRAPATKRRKRPPASNTQQTATGSNNSPLKTPASRAAAAVASPGRDGLRVRTRVQRLIAEETAETQDDCSQQSATTSALSADTNVANDDESGDAKLVDDDLKSAEKLDKQYSFPLCASSDGTFELLADDCDSLRALISHLQSVFSGRWRIVEHDTRKRRVPATPKGGRRSLQALRRAAAKKPTKAQLEADYAAECETAERSLIERLEELLFDTLETELKRAVSLRERRVLTKRDDDEYAAYFERRRREREEEERRARLREALKRKHEEALAEERERLEQRRQAIAERIAKAREREEELRKQRQDAAKRPRVAEQPYRPPIGTLVTGPQQPHAFGTQSRAFSSYVRDRDRAAATAVPQRRLPSSTAQASFATNPTMARLLGANASTTAVNSSPVQYSRPLTTMQARAPSTQTLVARTYLAAGQQRTIAVAPNTVRPPPVVNGQPRTTASIVCYQPAANAASVSVPQPRTASIGGVGRPNGTTQILIQRTVLPNMASHSPARPIVPNASNTAWTLGTVRTVNAHANTVPPLRPVGTSAPPPLLNGVMHAPLQPQPQPLMQPQAQLLGVRAAQPFAPRAPFRLYNIDNQLWTIDGVAARIIENRVMLMRNVQPSGAVLRALAMKRSELVAKQPNEPAVANAAVLAASYAQAQVQVPALAQASAVRTVSVDQNAATVARANEALQSAVEQARCAPSISITVPQSASDSAARNGFDEHAFDERSTLHNAPISNADILAESSGAADV